MINPIPILETFETITLAEMDKVKLMDRMDTKFAFSIHHLENILAAIKSNYKVLKIEDKRISRYESLYYDTPELYLYHRHHAGQLNRYKIRHRTYVESNIGFLEVKLKTNKGRTIKKRISQNEVPAQWEGAAEVFLKNQIPYKTENFVPAIWINYYRVTLINKSSPERLTIDLNLEFIKDGKKKIFQNLVIAEVKQEGKSLSPFIKLMKDLHLREGSISKYCMGVAMTYGDVKSNNFKPQLVKINNILKYDPVTNSH